MTLLKHPSLSRRLVCAMAGATLVILTPCLSMGGIVIPVVSEGNWTDSTTWSWSPAHGSKPEEKEARAPVADDTVLISRKEGCVIILAAQAPDMESIFVGHPSPVNTPHHLILEKGADLTARFLSIGRAGSNGPATEGSVELREGAILAIANETRLSENKEIASNSGHLLVRGGEFSTRTLLAGMGGEGHGSTIALFGSTGSFLVQRNVTLHGENGGTNALGVTLVYEPDAKGVTPLQISGDLQLIDQPRVKVDFAKIDVSALPNELSLIHVEGTTEGEFAPLEWSGLPEGIRAEGEWQEDQRNYSVKIIR